MRLDVESAARRLARRALRKRGFSTRFVETRAARLHVFDAAGSGGAEAPGKARAGELPSIVVLHGLCSSAAAFARMLVMLRPHARRVVALEMPGHGFSEAPRVPLTADALKETMREALDALVLPDDPALFVGNSLGGAVALGYAIERPERVERLVLLSPGGARMADDELRALLASFDLASTKDARRFLATIYHRMPWFMPAFAPGLLDMARSRAVRDLVGSVKNDDSPAPEDLARLSMPVLLLWGKSERLLPPSNLAWFKEHLPRHAVIEEPEAVGHCAHLDDPRGTVERILRFAREHARRT